MYNRVFKSNQISLGVPVKVQVPINFQNIKKAGFPKDIKENLPQEEIACGNDNSEDLEEMIENAREEAGMIIKEAELEAARIMEEASKEAEALMDSLFEESRQKGFELGYEEAKKQYEDLLEEAEFIKEHANVEYREILAGIEEDALNIILDIAKTVIKEEISINKENILGLVKQGFERCSNKDDIIIKVSTQDFEFVSQNRDKILSMAHGIGNMEIKHDPSLKEGSCIIETPFGMLDAGIHTKLRKIEEAFFKVITTKS